MSVTPDAGYPPTDEPGELLFDDDEVEQFLQGADGDLVAAGLRSLGPLIVAARQPATALEAEREGEMTELFRAVHATRKARTRRAFAVRVVAIAGVLTVASATAAAAGGGLPEPVQNTASSLLARVGISVPAGDSAPDSGPGAGVPDTSVPDTTVPAPTTAPAPETEPATGAGAEVAADESSEFSAPAPADDSSDSTAPAPQPEASIAPPAAGPEAAPAPGDDDQITPARRGNPHADKATPPGQDKQKAAKPPKPPKDTKPDKPEKP